jgi:hypothetical protein
MLGTFLHEGLAKLAEVDLHGSGAFRNAVLV